MIEIKKPNLKVVKVGSCHPSVTTTADDDGICRLKILFFASFLKIYSFSQDLPKDK